MHGATLNGIVNPNGFDTTVKFELGTDSNFGTVIDLPGDPLIGTADVPVSMPVEDLPAETDFFFRVVATNAGGTAEGATLHFVTPADEITPKPTVTTLDATNLH